MPARRLTMPLLAVVLLSGCTVVTPTASPDASHTAKPVGGPRTNPFGTVMLDPGTVVGTGALTSVDGLTSGSITIIADDDGVFDIHFSDFASPIDADVITNLSSEPFTEDAYCDGGFMTFVLDHPALAPTFTSSFDFGDLTFGNPDFLDTVVLTLNDASAPRTGCFYPVVATAPITWSIPDLRPDLEIIDSGPTGGATGTIAEADGEPASYEVTAGDVLAEIVARLGITKTDLFYLNPARDKGQQDQAFAGELFNLSKSTR